MRCALQIQTSTLSGVTIMTNYGKDTMISRRKTHHVDRTPLSSVVLHSSHQYMVLSTHNERLGTILQTWYLCHLVYPLSLREISPTNGTLKCRYVISLAPTNLPVPFAGVLEILSVAERSLASIVGCNVSSPDSSSKPTSASRCARPRP